MFSVLCPAERSQATDPMHDPALLPVDSVEDHFLMDAGSYDEVGMAFLEPRYIVLISTKSYLFPVSID